MPFFNLTPPDQIRHYCENQSLDDLCALDRRYDKFFVHIGEVEKRNNQEIACISAQINKTQELIEENTQRVRDAEKSRQHILDNLPDDAAERYLMLQHLNYSIDDQSSSLEKEMKQLNLQKNRLNLHNAWIHSEIRVCNKELKIISAVIREKELAVNPKLEQFCLGGASA